MSSDADAAAPFGSAVTNCGISRIDSSSSRVTSIFGSRLENTPPGPCAASAGSETRREPSAGQNRREASSNFSLHLGQYISIAWIAGNILRTRNTKNKALFSITENNQPRMRESQKSIHAFAATSIYVALTRVWRQAIPFSHQVQWLVCKRVRHLWPFPPSNNRRRRLQTGSIDFAFHSAKPQGMPAKGLFPPTHICFAGCKACQ